MHPMQFQVFKALKKFVSFAVEKSHWAWIAVDPKLYQCLFEIGLCITKEGGMAGPIHEAEEKEGREAKRERMALRW